MGKSYKCSNFHFVDQGTVLFWFLMVLLLVLVIGNFVLTVTIISFFKIGMGMENIKLIPELKIVKFYGIADFNKVYKKDGLIESYQDEPTFIGGEKSSLLGMEFPNEQNFSVKFRVVVSLSKKIEEKGQHTVNFNNF